MRLKIYQAPSVAQAMAQVRAEMGAEALILNTRRSFNGVELIASLEPVDTIDRGHADLLAFHAVPDRLRSVLVSGCLSDRLSQILTFGQLPLRSRPILLVGPPGAGKTLTVVRLATRLTLAGQPPVVVSADNAKAGANKQLSALLHLLGLDAKEAFDVPALSRLSKPTGSAMLIDTPGGNPFDIAHRDCLRAMATAVGAAIVLVLPAGLDPEETAELAIAYADAGAAFLVVTRLDLARRLGGVLAAADAARLPLTEAGIGPGAAGGLIPLTAAFLSERLLKTGAPHHAR